MNDFAQIAEEAGGSAAPATAAAGLRAALRAELDRGARELGLARSGYEAPIAVAFAPGEAVLPVDQAARADPAAASERAWLLVAAALGALVEAGAGPIAAGDWEGMLVLTGEGADPDLAALSFDERVRGVDRLRAVAVPVPAIAAPDDVRPAANPTFGVAERVARLGANPADPAAVEELAEAEDVARPHDDPDPALRAARRMLQRLRGMGKWGGYHTEFAHLAKGFPGHERALALEVGEALVRAGLLAEKPSVGQRHVYLDPRRAADVHALVDHGVTPGGLVLP